MLVQLHLRDLGVIDDAVLELAPGLNVITGETGAGKTMVVTGLGLLLGARADPATVRSGATEAVVEGLLDPPDDHPSRRRVAEAGGAADEEVILVRTVRAQGRSRAYVGGRAAPVGVLTEIGEQLVAVHGQADQWRLRRGDEHRALLDDVGGAPLLTARRDYESAYATCARLTAELARLQDLDRDRDVEIAVLSRGLAELEEIDPRPGEEDELAAEDERLGHADALRAAAASARAALVGADDESGLLLSSAGAGTPIAPAVDAVAAARAAMGAAASHDARLADLHERAAALGYLVTDLATDLASYADAVDVDPVRHAWVGERRAALAGLLRRHGPTTADVLAWGQEAARRLAELAEVDERSQQVAAELTDARRELRSTATELTAARRLAAVDLGRRVTDELSLLAMPRAVVEVAVEETDRPGPHGANEVDIRLAANPGNPARSVTSAASGGELSRVMLAIEVVASGATQDGAVVPTFVFDEVDAGVGGRAALAVGRRLAALARCAQVLVVTHLPQVAAFADQHLVVHKADDGHITTSGVRPVTGTDRLAELARMMAGHDSPLAREHAAQLLCQAQTVAASDTGRDAGRDSEGSSDPVPDFAADGPRA